MSRWQLAVAGTAAVGATVVAAWVLLLPYTMGQRTTSPFLDSIRQRWAESRSQQPRVAPLPLAQGRARAALAPGQRLELDPAGRFALLVPEAWSVTSAASGTIAFVAGSTTAAVRYPAETSRAMAGAAATATVDGVPAVRATDGAAVQVVAQLPGGYAALLAEGPEAASVSDALLAGVYLNR